MGQCNPPPRATREREEERGKIGDAEKFESSGIISYFDPAGIIRFTIVHPEQCRSNARRRLCAARTESEKNRLEIQIEALDRQIDAAVYELSGLNREEIAVLEGKHV